MISLEQDLDNYRQIINKNLERFFQVKIREAKKISLLSGQIAESLADYTLRGGKRLRSILFVYGYEAAGGKIDNNILRLSIFLELIQSSLLIHDDLIDNSDLRRGKMTIHREYQEKEANQQFGEAVAILMGDIATNYAYEIIAKATIDEKQKCILIEQVSNFVNQVNYGQVMDASLAKSDKIIIEEIEKVNYYKTVTYTSYMPLLAGALMAQGEKKLISNLSQYAINFGLAFQIIDDVIGIFGDEKQIGKSTMSDVIEGKKTYLMCRALELAENENKQYILQMLGNKKITNKQYDKLKTIIYRTGALDAAMDKATALINKAILCIKTDNVSSVTQDKLTNLALYILHKDKLSLNFRRKI